VLKNILKNTFFIQHWLYFVFFFYLQYTTKIVLKTIAFGYNNVMQYEIIQSQIMYLRHSKLMVNKFAYLFRGIINALLSF